ncbi:putative baseplate assembly protein [Microbacterium sp. BK668]|uniref:putative baseplate assembly protein n=1 Tax=Microbacterium sp. BK668 TaxID=2512118 RepID=UPI0010D1B627|nr:putative baseplate assembly protein [Microbacterium sp. BK668]TDN93063.1 putative phage baseplate assembly protein [Microbacterium sp. BK668]
MLPAPDLDDRRFQQLVDDAKRLVAARCREWSDHNVSDPGVTLIEAFAFMVDELHYRLNRVPDRLYIAFLDLLGVTLHPPAPARAEVLFRLSAARPDPVVVPAAAEVATRRSEGEEPIVFATDDELSMPPRRLTHIGRGEPVEVRVVHADDALPGEGTFEAFQSDPAPGDAVLFGLDDAAPRCLVAVSLQCSVRGVGVDPTDPPWQWQAWTGRAWRNCRVVSDGTGGFNQDGDVEVLLPAEHVVSVVGGVRAGWIRCIVTEPVHERQPAYTSSPLVHRAAASIVGGAVDATHAEAVLGEVLGLSEGVPGQVFALSQAPVVADGEPLVVEVAGGSGWEQWHEADSFAGHTGDDRIFTVDRALGELAFPPAVRERDGGLTPYGAVPPAGAPLRIPRYRVGGGRRGNVGAGSITVLRTTVPYVRSVENLSAALGGIDGETLEEAKRRGPLAVRTRDRAVTAQDYEQLAKAARPGIARVRCVPATAADGAVRLLVVPNAAPGADGHVDFADLEPHADLLAGVAEEIGERRTVGARVIVEPPFYRGVTIVARIVARPGTVPEILEKRSLAALYRHFDPVVGGIDGTGWPFGRPVLAGEVYAVLQSVPGVELVDELKLWEADPVTGKRAGEPVLRIDLDSNALVYSYRHSVRVVTGV